MSAKSNKIELSEEFMALRRKEQTLLAVMFRRQNLTRMKDKFQIISD